VLHIESQTHREFTVTAHITLFITE